MAEIKVTCITKENGSDYHHITHLGNPQTDWKWTVLQVIVSIEAKTNSFFLIDPLTSQRFEIGVIRPNYGVPYLRTYTDGVWTDNLLTLPSCSC